MNHLLAQWRRLANLSKVVRLAGSDIVLTYHPTDEGDDDYWRVDSVEATRHPKGRPFELGGGSSQIRWTEEEFPHIPEPLTRVAEGYSAFHDPWHLWQYVVDMGWADDSGEWLGDQPIDVIGFEGKVVGSGYDGEPTVRPTSQPFARMSWEEFDRKVEGGTGPWYEGINMPIEGRKVGSKTAMADSLEAVVESLEDTLGQIDNYERTRDLIASGQVGRQFSNQLDVWGYLRDLLPRELPGFDPEWVVVMPSYGRAAGMAAWDGEAKTAVFFIGPDGFNEVVVLHEVAHIIDQYKNGGRGHGPRFNGILSDLYGRYLGLKWAKLRVRYLEKV